MTYAIDEAVPMPAAKPRPERKPRVKKLKVSEAVRRAAQEYKAEYLAVYGARPTLTFDGEWIRVSGQSQGVKLRRLKEMTTQLRARRGK